MNITENTTGAASGLWLNPTVVSGLIALAGVVLGLIARDLFMAAYFARRKRADELADRKESEGKVHRDLVRLYADPLREAVKTLGFRLVEIVEKRQARYLMAEAPHIPFFEYKRISTLYRIAAVLGWIQAIRRERSYLDPDQASGSVGMIAIDELGETLADGTHVELHRLTELCALWHVTDVEETKKAPIAALIDGDRAEFLAAKAKLAARDLSVDEQAELSAKCADILRREAAVEISVEIVAATVVQAAAIFGIKEAYLYRDWQSAIGDMMLIEDQVGARHFSVMGFGRFEDLYLAAHRSSKKRSIELRWFDRLERIVHDVDMAQSGMFDARRELLQTLLAKCRTLEKELERLAAGVSAPADDIAGDDG
ncbi:MAG: hypothetical protein EOP18_02525 [Rhizobiaceae bacterium]|nr:MAG: hypothetical protein EOP18_02525 [Rhizobiaceae bacterium]